MMTPFPIATDGDGFFAHDGRRADQFLDGGSLGGQADEQAADLGFGCLAGHDVSEATCLRFIAREILAAAEFERISRGVVMVSLKFVS